MIILQSKLLYEKIDSMGNSRSNQHWLHIVPTKIESSYASLMII